MAVFRQKAGLFGLRVWFDNIITYGPRYGYFAEPTKSWLIVKDERYEEALLLFEGTGVQITTHGKKHLGAVIGQQEYKEEFVSELVGKWVEQLKALAAVAVFEPQCAYCKASN